MASPRHLPAFSSTSHGRVQMVGIVSPIYMLWIAAREPLGDAVTLSQTRLAVKTQKHQAAIMPRIPSASVCRAFQTAGSVSSSSMAPSDAKASSFVSLSLLLLLLPSSYDESLEDERGAGAGGCGGIGATAVGR